MNNIKMDIAKRGWGGVDWIGLAQDRDSWRALVNAVNEHSNKKEQIPWPLVRERILPTERQPLVDEI
jgi:hypothetical protein